VYFPQFCDITNLVEKNSRIYTGKKKFPKISKVFVPKRKKKKTTKNCLPKNHWIHYFGYITKLKIFFDEN
jgi:hypothetical protein